MIQTSIPKKLLFENISNGADFGKYITNWLKRGEFDINKNYACINDRNILKFFQNEKPEPKGGDWVREINELYDWIWIQYVLDHKGKEYEAPEGYYGNFLGMLELLDGLVKVVEEYDFGLDMEEYGK